MIAPSADLRVSSGARGNPGAAAVSEDFCLAGKLPSRGLVARTRIGQIENPKPHELKIGRRETAELFLI